MHFYTHRNIIEYELKSRSVNLLNLICCIIHVCALYIGRVLLVHLFILAFHAWQTGAARDSHIARDCVAARCHII